MAFKVRLRKDEVAKDTSSDAHDPKVAVDGRVAERNMASQGTPQKAITTHVKHVKHCKRTRGPRTVSSKLGGNDVLLCDALVLNVKAEKIKRKKLAETFGENKKTLEKSKK
jgi:hypothetical protein